MRINQNELNPQPSDTWREAMLALARAGLSKLR
jgi:hypothetical protein